MRGSDTRFYTYRGKRLEKFSCAANPTCLGGACLLGLLSRLSRLFAAPRMATTDGPSPLCVSVKRFRGYGLVPCHGAVRCRRQREQSVQAHGSLAIESADRHICGALSGGFNPPEECSVAPSTWRRAVQTSARGNRSGGRV